MASQTTSNSMDLLSIIWNPYQALQQALGQKQPPNILDLNDYCFMNIYRYIELPELMQLRCVSRRFLETIDGFLRIQKRLTYTCRINGITRLNGQYLFNIQAFEFIVKHMPALESINFDRCHYMRCALATCLHNLFDLIGMYLNDLKELHLGRSRFINENSLRQLGEFCPNLTHLTITIYNEDLLALIVEYFKQLRYLNLDRSIIYKYSSILKNLPPTLKIFMLPSDNKNEKQAILDSLCQSPAVDLERLEVSITVNDVSADVQYFDAIGNRLNKLKWFQCQLSCPAVANSFKINAPSALEINNNQIVPGLQEINNNHVATAHLDHIHPNLISGLSRLTDLRVLILSENDYYDTETRCSLFDDNSLCKIFHCCSKLIMLSISCTLSCKADDYVRPNVNRSQDIAVINRILNKYISKIDTEEYVDTKSKSSHVTSGIYHPEDKLIHGLEDKSSWHTVSDLSLASIDIYLPRLRILQLRGIRIGRSTFHSISNLNELELLRLDSIKFPKNEPKAQESFSEMIVRLTQTADVDDHRPKPVIHLTNIPLI